ncbi:MAG: insulinase family protein, partial [Bacteroidales bacterium]|nr:insulinase family protein [Bacteroidales bacterium]
MKKMFLLLAAVWGCVMTAHGQTPLPNDPAVKVGKLDNGMTYYIRHNDKPAQRAEFYLATHVGAIQETPDQDGLAHFLEHMCFNGLKNLPGKQMLEYLQRIGAEFGRNINASTGVESTQYMLNNIPVTREGIIDTCLLVMHDYSHFVTNDPVEMDKERGVILEERRTRRNAQWRMYEQSKRYLYKGSKYAECSLIGSQENLETFKPESLVAFYETWYRPDNQALIVVGDIDPDQIEAKIKTLFADIPAPVNPTAKDVIKIPDNEEPIVGIVTDPEATSSSITVLWKDEPLPVQMNNTDVALMTDLLKDIVGNIMSERFDDITKKADAPFMDAGFGFYELCETCDATVGSLMCKDGEMLSSLQAFYTEIEKMKRYGFSEDEISRAKEEIISRYEKAATGADSRQNSEFVYPLIQHFFHNKPYMEPATALKLVKMIMPALQPAVINKVAAAAITDENLVILCEGPQKEGLNYPSEAQLVAAVEAVKGAEIAANVEEKVEKEFVNPAKLKGGKVKQEAQVVNGATEWTLSNGIKVVVLPTEYRKDQVLLNF